MVKPLSIGLLCAGAFVVNGCQTPGNGGGGGGGGGGGNTNEPPTVVDHTGNATWTMNAVANVKFAAENGTDPIVWIDTHSLPTWNVTANGRDLKVSGVMGVGSHSPGVTVDSRAQDNDGRLSEVFSCTIRSNPLVFDAGFAQHKGKLPKALDELLRTPGQFEYKAYQIKLTNLPPWPDGNQGEVKVWVDTEGLAPAGPVGDTITLFDEADGNPNKKQDVTDTGLTKATARDAGETFTLTGEQWRQATLSRQIGCALVCHHGSSFRIVRVEVTVH